jgi:hypothetical protein
MLVFILLLCSTIIQVNTSLENSFCSLSSSDELMIQNIPTIFELNVPYTGKWRFSSIIIKSDFFLLVILSSNNTLLLSYITLDIETSFNTSNDSYCLSTNESFSSFIHKTEFILKFEKNSIKTKCIQLK